MELQPIVVGESPHKSTGRNPKPLVVECEEAHHIARQWIGLPRIHHRHDALRERHCWCSLNVYFNHQQDINSWIKEI